VDEKKALQLRGFIPSKTRFNFQKLKEYSSPFFSMHGVSFNLDGPLYNRLASLTTFYKKRKKEGVLFYSATELVNMVSEIKKHKLQVSFKATGDKAIAQAIACCDKLQQLNHSEKNRFFIKQANISSEEALNSMLSLNMSPSFSLADLSIWGAYIIRSVLPTIFLKDFLLTKSALSLNTKCSLTNSSDILNINPLNILETAITRKNSLERIFYRQERLSIDQALECLTLHPAWQLQLDDKIGSLEVGKQADFVILSSSPKKVAANKISTIQVIETWVQGHKVF
jgi:predicted amidohydrolase YtcJ